MKVFSPLLFLISCSLLMLTGCDRALTILAGEAHGGSLDRSSWSGDNASVSSARFVTARTPAEWDALWVTIGQQAPGPLPSGKMAVAVFLGQRFEAGSRAEIVDAEILRHSGAPDRPVVTYRELSPAIAAKSESVLSPWTVRLMDRNALMPDFQRIDG